MQKNCLIDTNILEYWFDDHRKEYSFVRARVGKLPDSVKLAISVVTLGEIHYGHHVENENRTPDQEKFITFVKSKTPWVLNIDDNVAEVYGRFRARLFNQYVSKSERKGLRPEQIIDPVSSKVLGIQENDLWIAAQASVYNLTLVTNDKMYRIREVAGNDLTVDNWTAD